MMTVIFILREPGNHHEIFRTQMPCVPREGEAIAIEDVPYLVHEVTWHIRNDGTEAWVLIT